VLVVRLLGLGLAFALVAVGTLSVITLFFQQRTHQSSAFAGPVRQVVAETDVGKITLRRAEPGQALVVRRTLTWSFRRPEAEVVNTAGVVTVSGRCLRQGTSLGACSVDMDILLPPEVAVQITTKTGDIHVEDVGGEITATAKTGDVKLRGLRSSRVNATTATGDIEVELVTAPKSVQAQTSTGDLRIIVPDDGTIYRISARATVGTQNVKIPTSPTATSTISASTSVGDLTLTVARRSALPAPINPTS
jgi:hypothetical protein